MNVLRALASGFVGASALTLIHESARRTIPKAPRADVLGMRALDRILRKGDFAPPPDDRLHRWALAGDLAANSLFYGARAARGFAAGSSAWAPASAPWRCPDPSGSARGRAGAPTPPRR